jgi:hypothetical protein
MSCNYDVKLNENPAISKHLQIKKRLKRKYRESVWVSAGSKTSAARFKSYFLPQNE